MRVARGAIASLVVATLRVYVCACKFVCRARAHVCARVC